jgi:hypothetical protein
VLLETIKTLSAESEADVQQSEYSAVSPESSCQMAALKFLDTEQMTLAAANEVISSYAKSNSGPTFLLLNSSKPLQQLRRAVPSCNSFPIVPLPFPPCPSHNPSMRTLSFSRQLVKSRALTWASELPGFPDLGVNFLPSPSGGDFPSEDQSGILVNQNDDDDELASPVIRRPRAYRCICIEIDVHDLAIAALTDPSSSQSTFARNQADGQNSSSPNNVTMFDTSIEGMAKNTMKCQLQCRTSIDSFRIPCLFWMILLHIVPSMQ